MRLLRLGTNYPSYLQQFYAQHPNLAAQPYATQHAALMVDCFGWGDFWSCAFAKLGYQTAEIIGNAKALQQAWAQEHGLACSADNWLFEIVAAQVKDFQPAILFLNDYHTYTADFLHQLRKECGSIRLILGWCGAPYNDPKVFGAYDLVLSCIPEMVATFRQLGHRTYHVQHAFEPRVLERIETARPPVVDFSFIGQIVKRERFHNQRELLLKQLVRQTNLEIWSAVERLPLGTRWYHATRQLAYHGIELAQRAGVPSRQLEAFGPTRKILRWRERTHLSALVDPRIACRAHPPVYGRAMYQILHDSKVALNTHIDIAPRSASNMRLFEATGVGTCLLTDWKENLVELFEPDREVVAYHTVAECIEKVRYLLAHDAARQAIAAAGQRRTLRDHTFAQRAVQLDAIIRECLA